MDDGDDTAQRLAREAIQLVELQAVSTGSDSAAGQYAVCRGQCKADVRAHFPSCDGCLVAFRPIGEKRNSHK